MPESIFIEDHTEEYRYMIFYYYKKSVVIDLTEGRPHRRSYGRV